MQLKQPLTIHIRPTQSWHVPWRELWAYHELLLVLMWRDIKVRYKQTAIGVMWAILQPAMQVIVFTFLFGSLAKMPSSGIPYPLFSFTGLMIWQFFAKGLNEASLSLVSNQTLLSKVYFPRVVLPLASILAGVVDWCVMCGMLVVLLLAFGYSFSLTMLLMPVWLLLAFLCCFSLATWLAAWNAIYRDVGYAVPFLIQIGMFACPVVYPSHLVPAKSQMLYHLNPLANIIEGARWSVLKTPPPSFTYLLISCVLTVVVGYAGLVYFTQAERTLTDRI